MIKYLIIAVVIFAVFKFFTNDLKRKRQDAEKEQPQSKEKMPSGEELVKDPICGAYVSVENSISVKDGDKIHRFCCYDCRDIFLKQVEQEERKNITSENSSQDKSDQKDK
jgi:preprotein translocase subunit YajC